MVFAMLVGILLGAFFFGGLWWTIHRGVLSRQPALWFFGSMVLRTCLVVLGFYYMLGDHWQTWLAGLSGFVISRVIATRLAGEASHAP